MKDHKRDLKVAKWLLFHERDNKARIGLVRERETVRHPRRSRLATIYPRFAVQQPSPASI
ncbi:hypothetical protein GCM10010201_23840 [Pilimelia columellifera subsp. columellifera]|uniref:Uncharacterized protein n=1 Tax=Pilimelia columellifera subsp. columellifera TaxID=706583 RepID=A0ABP6AVG3_9ACTN